MINYEKYFEILDSTEKIALATSGNGVPNVRIVNFCYDKEKPGTLYFTSSRKNQKVKDFENNNKVAFTTVPPKDSVHIRSNNATVEKSKLSIDDVKELFLSKIPGYDEALSAIGHLLELYEIHINEATMVLGMAGVEKVTF